MKNYKIVKRQEGDTEIAEVIMDDNSKNKKNAEDNKLTKKKI